MSEVRIPALKSMQYLKMRTPAETEKRLAAIRAANCHPLNRRASELLTLAKQTVDDEQLHALQLMYWRLCEDAEGKDNWSRYRLPLEMEIDEMHHYWTPKNVMRWLQTAKAPTLIFGEIETASDLAEEDAPEYAADILLRLLLRYLGGN